MAGTIYCRWPKICEHFGWDASKLCGPACMALMPEMADDNCCYGCPPGSPRHKPPPVAGKPFALSEHREELKKLGLTTSHQELKQKPFEHKKPPGQPIKQNGVMVYPVPHFA